MVEGNFQNIQIIGDLLKAAVPAPLAGGAKAVVLGQEKLHDLSPVAADLEMCIRDSHMKPVELL